MVYFGKPALFYRETLTITYSDGTKNEMKWFHPMTSGA
jgi:hypothetical protein